MLSYSNYKLLSKLTDSYDSIRLVVMTAAYAALKRFGLTDGEIKVYLEALKKDELTPFSISKLTGIPRTTVYDILMGLSLKGLVELKQSDGFTKQQTLVKAKNPSVLRTILQNKRKELTSIEADILDVLQELKGDYHKNESNANFQFFPGITGAKKVYFDSFSNEDLKLASFTWDLQMPMDVFGVKEMNADVSLGSKKRVQGRSENKELMPLNDWTKHVITYQYGRDKKYLENMEYRYIEDSSFEVFLRLNIKGNFVRIACAYEDEVWGIKVRSRFLAATFRAVFLQNWKLGTPITEGVVKSWGKSEFLEEHRAKKLV